MMVRGFSEKTRHDYIRIVAGFAAFLGRSRDTATAEDIRRFQVHQSDLGTHAPAMNSTVAALRFFFTQTLDWPDLSRKLIRLRYTRKLPAVLSAEEVARLLAAAKCLKHRAALAVAYDAGLRVAEVASLRVGDIDSARMLIRVERGKGGRYRHAMLSPDLLTLLQGWWQEGRRQGAMLPGVGCFPASHRQTPAAEPAMRPVLEIADILRRHGPAWRAARAGHVSLDQLKVMSAIETCRTAALGSHVEGCEDCGHERIAYNSCRNRHCPKCQGAKAREWLAARKAELLPVGYFHVVFSIPAELADIVLQSKAEVYDLLFRTASETMLTIAADPRHLGARIGITAMLHSWGSALTHHPHIHMIVPSGGISLDGTR
jgi:hypothetical protein